MLYRLFSKGNMHSELQYVCQFCGNLNVLGELENDQTNIKKSKLNTFLTVLEKWKIKVKADDLLSRVKIIKTKKLEHNSSFISVYKKCFEFQIENVR